ncbi:Gram-negative bacterial tonB protein [Mariniflexile rhizosphaerae]|uniref:energy transducer TonB n=1 Tax=unclassified Mariniflexile TaxID=2643887 RepID=UPI000CC68FA9|nr:energy transducer TonB [Mariniflexile sp. TRM1-10]AXP81058.1 Gram-negative bacterial tonB protein [Mariniflexile sp. TRM1-10]PLB18765.1 MAG: TonB family protein [Flavobacteriaceae bacterium FS1-H7996/R]
MSNSKKTHEPIRQNGEIVKKSQKHDANLRKNSSLYFQIGLIVCLLAAYGLLEMKFEKAIPKIADIQPPNVTYVAEMPLFRPEVAVVEEPVKQKASKPKNDDYEVVPDTAPDVFDKPEKPTVSVVKPLNTGDVTLVDKPVEPEDVIFEKIEQVPIYPGCEKKKTNDEKRKCMSDKITQLIQKKFNTNLGGELGLSGKQVIRTQFKIDKTGHVKDIQVRGTHPDLEKEAARVINIIPEMTPGKQRDKNVGVIYTLPIVFQVQD